MTTSPLHRLRGGRALLLSAVALGGAGIAAAPASAGVTLDWSTVNVYGDSARTFLGYATNPSAMGGAKGTVSPIAPATGPTVTPTSARGLGEVATWSYPAASGSFNPVELRGDISFRGGVSFVSPAFVPPTGGGHGFTITLENPRVVLDGPNAGQIFATGLHTPGGINTTPVAYDASQPVFAVYRSAWTVNADGSSTITIAPKIATEGIPFPGGVRGYPADAGPDRTPNTFGSFTIRVAPDGGPKGDKGDAGAKGDKGDKGDAGKNGTTTTIRIQTASLAKAPFKGKATRKVKVTARKSSKVLATGTVKGRTLTVTLAKGKKQLKGVYVLRVAGKKATATVRLP